MKDNEKTVADIKSFPWREGDPDKDYAMKVAEILPVLLQDEELVMSAVVHTWDNFVTTMLRVRKWTMIMKRTALMTVMSGLSGSDLL